MDLLFECIGLKTQFFKVCRQFRMFNLHHFCQDTQGLCSSFCSRGKTVINAHTLLCVFDLKTPADIRIRITFRKESPAVQFSDCRTQTMTYLFGSPRKKLIFKDKPAELLHRTKGFTASIKICINNPIDLSFHNYEIIRNAMKSTTVIFMESSGDLYDIFECLGSKDL